ncbi:MAG: hypothetical protein NW206_20255 [Hyphomonadaceae bacterium]|nr:hypothetical protein [Hyphomonadaceae bacterium]
MSAQSWSVKGIDPKVREAVREAAARSGMTLGEYLSAALQNQHGKAPYVAPRSDPFARQRPRPTYGYDSGADEDDWSPGGAPSLPRSTDPVRLAQRIDSIERRTQLAVTGLDRAVSTIDRSVLGLAARVEDAERVSSESADRIADALEHFRIAGDTLGGRLEHAEAEINESRRALEAAHSDLAAHKALLTEQFNDAHSDLMEVRDRLEQQAATAEEVARRAEAAVSFLANEIENRDARNRGELTEARRAAEEAARQAAGASLDAINELRRLHEHLAERLTETEGSTRRAVETAIEQSRSEQAQIEARALRAETEARAVRDSLLEEVVRLEGEIGARIASADQLKSEQALLISRIERAEAAARESTAGLRQAAGAAIADLRNAQLTLSARVKQIEDVASRGGGSMELGEVKAQQSEIADRLAALEQQMRANPMGEALAAFEKRLAEIDARIASAAANEKLESVDGAVKTMDQAMQRLAQRIAEAENTANTAIRTLEETVSSLGAKVEANNSQRETEALRQMLEQRLDTMAQSVTQMVGDARADLQSQVSAALSGAPGAELEGALADVNRRLAAAESRQAQTIEAISFEIKRMSETVDKRLRAVEARNDDAAGNAVREELTRMAQALEDRFDEIERREAAAFDRMGLEVGRLSERLEDRVGAVESRSAQAIEQVGEQVARMAERFNHRHEALARDLGERMMDSEERSSARVSEAISSIMQRLTEVEEQSVEAIEPVKKAMTSVASRLEAYESSHDEEMPTPARRFSDMDAFDAAPPLYAPQPYVAPMEAAKPLRAGPLPPAAAPTLPPEPEATADSAHHDDIYFAEDVEEYTPSPELAEAAGLVVAEIGDTDAYAPAPLDDDEPFWSPDDAMVTLPEAEDTAPLSSTTEEFVEAAATPRDDLVLEPLEEPAPPASKNDYLNAARKAAQAQVAAKPGKAAKPAKPHKAKAERDTSGSLRGSSRVILWGSASALTLLIAGGAWYLKEQQDARSAPEPAPAQEPAQAAPNAAAAPFGAVQDPFAVAPAEGAAAAAPTEAGEAAPNAGAPVASAAPAAQPVVAGPLAPRNVSLEQAAASGQIVAQYELALQRLSAGRAEEGATLLRQAANRGLAMAQYRLAKLYERGEGVPADLVQARQWTERAAAAGNRRAMHDLGVYFARGEGAPLDEAAAFRWFRQAAELGVADSQYNLGVLYQQGRGVGASASEALFWFMVAARQGDEDAGARAQALQAQLQPVQVEQARARAQAFRPRAASALANGEFGPRPWAATAAPRPNS